MTERLADVSARIDGIEKLGAVVNAMKGIAAARAHVARTQLDAIDGYADTIAAAIGDILTADDRPPTVNNRPKGRKGLLVFCAEQGFAGAFSERVLASITDDPARTTLFLVGTRGLSIATTQGRAPFWSIAMPSHTPGIPKMADMITRTIYQTVEEGRIDSLDVIYSAWHSGHSKTVRQALFPVDLTELSSNDRPAPLIQLSKAALIDSLSADYFHALVCKASLHAFAAENEARLEAMSSAGSQIEHELEVYRTKLHRVRQEEITAEIIELSTGIVSATHKIKI
ncbi:F0F1 ATP synthase subunit gamma [uncultured Thalassospira sp.]|uniref:F0F1 ATP synthase subunit gamma n=1 Tax=uncultured Thalassospira sp. TaxID=404382 RepID=UPI0030DAB39E